MKKIILTGNSNVDNLIYIVKDIINKVSNNYEIEKVNKSTIAVNILNTQNDECYVIANVDNEVAKVNMDIPLGRFITLGLNGKASVTLSSVGGDLDIENTLIYCIQREINEEDTIIEPQEFPVKIKHGWGTDVYNILSAVTAVLLVDRSITDKLNSI